jgi:hypothetical protein
MQVSAGAGEFGKVDAHQSDIDNRTGDSGDGDAIAAANAVAANQERLCNYGQDHVLQGHRDAGSQQAGVSGKGPNLAYKAEHDDDCDRAGHHYTAYRQELRAAAHVADAAESNATPHRGNHDHRADRERQNAKA